MWECDNGAIHMKITERKGIFLKIGAFLGGTPILGPQGPKKGGPPQICPYRPLISYKIGQMPTVTRGG